jgi:hypothetical protein
MLWTESFGAWTVQGRLNQSGIHPHGIVLDQTRTLYGEDVRRLSAGRQHADAIQVGGRPPHSMTISRDRHNTRPYFS